MTHICVGNLTIIGSDNGLSRGRRQAIIWTSAGILLIGPLGTNFSEMLIEIHTFSFKKIHLQMSSGKWRPFCLGLNVLEGILFCESPYWVNVFGVNTDQSVPTGIKILCENTTLHILYNAFSNLRHWLTLTGTTVIWACYVEVIRVSNIEVNSLDLERVIMILK